MTDSGPSSSKPAPPRSGGAGFTVVEIIVAVGIIGAAMLTVLMAASSGVIFQGMARQRQTATGIANQVMEQLRALPLADLQVGINDTNGALKNDPNVKLCRGKGSGKKGATNAYRLFSCTSSSDVGAAEALVYYDCSRLKAGETCPTANAPLGSGNGGTVTADGVPYTWHAYLTSRSSVLAQRFTVVVDWSWRGRAYSTRVQSLAWAPTGCVSSLTHFVSAPCGSGSGGQGDAGLITVNVSWVDAAGVNQSFSWRPGQLSGTYREEGTQGKFLSGSSSLPNGALASTISDNDANTADLEFASLSTVQTTSASYPTFPSITTPGTYPYLEARFFAGAAGSAYPSARALSGVATTSGVPTPCNGSPFFITTVPCLGLRSDGGANAIIVAYRQSAALSFPLLKIEPGYLGNTCSSAAPCLWQAKYNFQPVSGTKTFDIFRLVPKVSIASYSKLNASGTEAGTGCQDVSLDCTTFGASLASLCDNVRLALGSTLQNVNLPATSGGCGTTGHAGTLDVAMMTSATCSNSLTTLPPTAVGGTNPPCVGTQASGRMWRLSNYSFAAGSLTGSATAAFDYQVLSCAYSDDGGGSGNLISSKCNSVAGYTGGTQTVCNAQGKCGRRVITAVTPSFRVVIILPVLTANAVSYEDW